MPNARTSRNKRLLQGARSRDEILDAASRIMSARGFDGTSVADIARESGLPNSSIYWHFSSKAGILAAVMERGAQRFFADVAPPPRQPGEDPGDYLRRTLPGSGQAFAAHQDFWRLFVVLLISNDNAEVAEIIARVRQHGRDSLARHLAAAYDGHGEAAALRVTSAIADFALVGFDGIFLFMQAHPGAPTEPLIDQLAESLAELGSRILHGGQPEPARLAES